MSEKVQGYYWHKSCITGPPGDIRSDVGHEPRRGTWIDRAITLRHGRVLDGTDSNKPHCHVCLKGTRRTDHGGPQEDFVVLSYALTADMCTCGARYHGYNHDGLREMLEDIWADAPEMEGADEMDKLVCGDCWYRDNNLPPDERRSMEVAVECSDCGSLTNEVIVIERESRTDEVIDVDEIDEDTDPRDLKVVITWYRQEVVNVEYTYTLDRLDSDDLEALIEGDFSDVAYDVASDESTTDNEVNREFYDWVDGVEEVEWEVLAK